MPREGHDSPRKWLILRISISIHVPREGHDFLTGLLILPIVLFQSTCPARGTTFNGVAGLGNPNDFNPRAPRGARRKTSSFIIAIKLFQSTCPARGTTRSGITIENIADNFNPRAPRGARRAV